MKELVLIIKDVETVADQFEKFFSDTANMPYQEIKSELSTLLKFLNNKKNQQSSEIELQQEHVMFCYFAGMTGFSVAIPSMKDSVLLEKFYEQIEAQTTITIQHVRCILTGKLLIVFDFCKNDASKENISGTTMFSEN